MTDRRCDCQCSRPRRRLGLVGLILNVALLYGVLLVGGGTLQRVDHPVAVETGRLMHTVAFVEPTVYWLQGNDHPRLAGVIDRLARGFELG